MASDLEGQINRRIIVIDDNTAIHADFSAILQAHQQTSNEAQIAELDAQLFGNNRRVYTQPQYDLDVASQGLDGIELVERHVQAQEPYAVAFVDMRMPPGIDGLATVEGIWKAAPGTEVVICTAFSDHSWNDIILRLGLTDQLLMLRKPFDPTEVRQLAAALTVKWSTRERMEYERRQVDDLVDRRTLELRSTNARLECLIDDLREAQANAERANAAKSLFLAHMSHEIRTPMNGVLATAELLARSPLDSEQQLLVDTLCSSSGALLQIIDDILDVSKLEAGKMKLERLPVDLRSVAREIRQLLAPRFNAKSLAFELDIDDELPECLLMDPVRTRQVLMNLGANAIKFTESGEVRIAVTCETIDPNNRRVTISVSDTGIGITERQQAKLFSDYAQASDSTTREYGGTGLGLSICRRIVELMNSNLELQSQSGHGSKFYFQCDLEVADPAEQIRDSQQEPTDDHFEATVLVVDDNPINRLVAAKVLAHFGCEVEFAETGEQALERMATAEYALVFMDLIMPGIDGLETVRRQRARETEDERCTIIAMTADTIGEVRAECLEAGMDDFMAKPMVLREVRQTLGRWLGDGPTRRRAVA